MRPEIVDSRQLLRLVLVLVVACWTLIGDGANPAWAQEDSREVGRISSGELSEISGLVASRQNAGILWVHNDGPVNEVIAIQSDGDVAARVRIAAKTHDVEDIAIGPGEIAGVDYLYLGDIGDNERKRREIRIVRFAEPKVAADRQQALITQDVEEFRLRYPDGAHDAEALLVDPVTGDVLIATKEEDRSRVYQISAGSLNGSTGIETLQPVAQLKLDKVSGGEVSPAGNFVVLRDDDRAYLWTRRPGETVAETLRGAPQIMRARRRGQNEKGEAIGFSPNERSFFTVSEGKHEPIFLFSLPKNENSPSG